MRNKVVLIVCSIIIIADEMGYLSKPHTAKTISSEDVYPKGDIKQASIFDKQYKEKPITLSQDDAHNIMKY